MRGTVYVVEQGRFEPFGDISGVAVSADEVLWGHMSSNRWWLERDLTTGFADRAERLAAKFPDGFDVVYVAIGDDVPAPIRHHFIPAQDPTRCPACDSGQRGHRGFPEGGDPYVLCDDPWHDTDELEA